MELFTGNIYSIINTNNGMIYVGQTRRDGGYIARWNEHLYDAFGKKKKRCYIDNVIRKHGADAFSVNLIDKASFSDGDECVNWMDEREIFFIKFYNSKANGYNLTDGGRGNRGWKMPEHQVRMQSERLKGKPGLWLGKNHSMETKIKMSEQRRAAMSDPERKKAFFEKVKATKEKNGTSGRSPRPVLKFNAEGFFVGEFLSRKAAAINCNVDPSNISASCRGESSCHGFHFRDKSDFNGVIPKNIDIRSRAASICKAIDQFGKNGEFIASFNSATEASVSIGANKKGISRCASGFAKTYKGYIWKLNNKKQSA